MLAIVLYSVNQIANAQDINSGKDIQLGKLFWKDNLSMASFKPVWKQFYTERKNAMLYCYGTSTLMKYVDKSPQISNTID